MQGAGTALPEATPAGWRFTAMTYNVLSDVLVRTSGVAAASDDHASHSPVWEVTRSPAVGTAARQTVLPLVRPRCQAQPQH